MSLFRNLLFRYGRSIAQVIGTLAILVLAIPSEVKVLLLFGLWAITFRDASFVEIIFYLLICAFFTAMNAASLHQGIFVFDHPDLLGMPYYEFFMWGFYLLHTKRVLGGRCPERIPGLIVGLAFAYALSFGVLSDPTVLLVSTAFLLLCALAIYHTPKDLAYTGYMVFLGALVEYSGVSSGQWHYPDSPPGGVPLWFVTLWGGVGFFLHRLALPILARFEAKGAVVRDANR